MTFNLMLDVGGTSIKAGIIDQGGNLYKDKILSFDAKSKAGEKEIFDNFVEILNVLVDQLPEAEGKIEGVGMAFPGPFDYKEGISRMRGLDKYDSIFGIRIADRIRKDFKNARNGSRMTEDCCFVFMHDVNAFAAGESCFGKAREWNRVMYFCMGTGAGSAFSINHRILEGEEGQVPENGWIYATPFRDGIIDDYLSIRGLEILSREVFGKVKNGRELFELCGQNDERALLVYREFGSWLKEAMMPFVESFQPDGFVLGGQISKSFPYFGEEFLLACREQGVQICLAADTSKRTMEGLYLALRKRMKYTDK